MTPTTISTKALTFRPSRNDYQPGDDRTYDVIYRGRTIGTVEPDWMPSATPNGDPVASWNFGTFDGTRKGYGRTRAQAVADAYPGESA